jgi:Zinc carboxypeptidase
LTALFVSCPWHVSTTEPFKRLNQCEDKGSTSFVEEIDRYHIFEMITPEERFGAIPALVDVNEWLIQLGWNRTVVGTSVQGRDLVAYEMCLSLPPTASAAASRNAGVNMMYLSLTHGNEPMGLVSLLATAHELSQRQHRHDHTNATAKVVIFPFVNIDAYVENFHNDTEHRVNWNGVDLNRNYANSWFEQLQQLHKQPHYQRTPFSEPETRAVRTVVETLNITHALSFHSMGYSERPRLLIHPFASERPWNEMPAQRAKNYHHWSRILNDQGHYAATGTAMETIGYTALGTTMDWMDAEHNIYVYVIEAVPPCPSRFCRNDCTKVWHEATIHAQTACRFLDIAVGAPVPTVINCRRTSRKWFSSQTARVEDSGSPSLFEMKTTSVLLILVVACHRIRRYQ